MMQRVRELLQDKEVWSATLEKGRIRRVEKRFVACHQELNSAFVAIVRSASLPSHRQ
jgi:hypothetical protein